MLPSLNTANSSTPIPRVLISTNVPSISSATCSLKRAGMPTPSPSSNSMSRNIPNQATSMAAWLRRTPRTVKNNRPKIPRARSQKSERGKQTERARTKVAEYCSIRYAELNSRNVPLLAGNMVAGSKIRGSGRVVGNPYLIALRQSCPSFGHQRFLWRPIRADRLYEYPPVCILFHCRGLRQTLGSREQIVEEFLKATEIIDW